MSLPATRGNRNEPGAAISDANDPAEVWRVLRAQPQPVLAFLEHCASAQDADAERAHLCAVMSPRDAQWILPEIRRELWFKAAWERKQMEKKYDGT